MPSVVEGDGPEGPGGVGGPEGEASVVGVELGPEGDPVDEDGEAGEPDSEGLADGVSHAWAEFPDSVSLAGVSTDSVSEESSSARSWLTTGNGRGAGTGGGGGGGGGGGRAAGAGGPPVQSSTVLQSQGGLDCRMSPVRMMFAHS